MNTAIWIATWTNPILITMLGLLLAWIIWYVLLASHKEKEDQ